MKKNLFTLLGVTFMFMLMSSCSTVEPPIEDPQTKFDIVGPYMCMDCGYPVRPNIDHVCGPPITAFCGDCGEEITTGTIHDCPYEIGMTCPYCGEFGPNDYPSCCKDDIGEIDPGIIIPIT